MGRFLLVVVVALFCAGEAAAQAVLDLKYNGTCVTQAVDSTTADDFCVASGGRLLDVTLEQDTSGAGVAISAVLYMCSTVPYASAVCKLLSTTEFDGTLDGTPANVQSVAVGPYLCVDLTGTIGSETPVVTVCAR